jgi:hypothetical protein
MHRITLCVLAAVLLPVSMRAEQEPAFAGVWSSKEPGAAGGLFHGMSWDVLVSRWKELGAGNQYLANVEVYDVNGQPRYAAVWRVGPGNGGLYQAPWKDFLKAWNDVMDAQELIDLEVVDTAGGQQFLGVWRRKQGRERGSGALYAGLTWDQLVAKRAELGEKQYLADVETYVRGGQRLFAGVWRVGKGNGALYWKKDWSEFAELKQTLNKNQEMLDFEMFQSKDGNWNFLGVWRVSERAGPLHASTSNAKFNPLTAAQFVERWQTLQKAETLIGLTVAVPAPPPLTSLRGSTACNYGDPDCNRCATDVPTQFKLAFETGHRPWIGWDAHSWNFRGNHKYPPDGLRPEYAFKPYGEGKDVGVVVKHIQGFVRTNSSRFPYAGSHSHKSTGSIFFVERDGGKTALHALYRSNYAHPSGVAVLGDGLFVAEGTFLRRFSVSAAGRNQPGPRFDLPRNDDKRGLENGGGGLGLAKLHDGTTLLIVSAPGGGFRPHTRDVARDDNARARYTRLYRFVPDVFAKNAESSLLGEWKHPGVSSKPDGPGPYSENLSVVTECGSGNIYTIHTTGEYALKGDGYWRLSRVDGTPDHPRLVHVATSRQSQNNESCHHRSSATVHVNKEGELEFLCSERAVIKWHPTGRFDFREGTR